MFMSLRNGELCCMSCSVAVSKLLEAKETKATKELKRCVTSFNACLAERIGRSQDAGDLLILRGGSGKSPKCSDVSPSGSSSSKTTELSLASSCPRGLVNQGNTCFFNSVLQNVFNIPAIRLWAAESEGSTGGSFARALAQSCLDIFSGNSASFLPKRIFNLVHWLSLIAICIVPPVVTCCCAGVLRRAHVQRHASAGRAGAALRSSRLRQDRRNWCAAASTRARNFLTLQRRDVAVVSAQARAEFHRRRLWWLNPQCCNLQPLLPSVCSA